MLLRDGCNTSYDPSLSCGKRNTSHLDWKNPKTHWHEAVSSTSNAPFLKEVSQNCFLFEVVNFKKNQEVSQNCFFLDIVKLKQWGNLQELFRFGCCYFRRLSKSGRIVSFSSLQTHRKPSRNREIEFRHGSPLKSNQPDQLARKKGMGQDQTTKATRTYNLEM